MKIIQNLLLALCLISAFPAFAETTVNINTADATTLATMLDGIGEKKAEAIVAYREENGPFKSINALSNVKGIGESTVAKNQAVLSLSDQ